MVWWVFGAVDGCAICVYACACACACVRAPVRLRVRLRVRECVRACVRGSRAWLMLIIVHGEMLYLARAYDLAPVHHFDWQMRATPPSVTTERFALYLQHLLSEEVRNRPSTDFIRGRLQVNFQRGENKGKKK